MRQRWLDAPWWVWSLISGAFFAVGIGVFTDIQHHQWLTGGVAGLVAGALFGGVMGPRTATTNREASRALAPVPPAIRKRAGRLAYTGPVPENEELRQAALYIAGYQLDRRRRTPWYAIFFFALFTVVYVVKAMDGSPGWWAAAAFFTAMLVARFVFRRRFTQRVALLSGQA